VHLKTIFFNLCLTTILTGYCCPIIFKGVLATLGACGRLLGHSSAKFAEETPSKMDFYAYPWLHSPPVPAGVGKKYPLFDLKNRRFPLFSRPLGTAHKSQNVPPFPTVGHPYPAYSFPGVGSSTGPFTKLCTFPALTFCQLLAEVRFRSLPINSVPLPGPSHKRAQSHTNPKEGLHGTLPCHGTGEIPDRSLIGVAIALGPQIQLKNPYSKRVLIGIASCVPLNLRGLFFLHGFYTAAAGDKTAMARKELWNKGTSNAYRAKKKKILLGRTGQEVRSANITSLANGYYFWSK